MESALPTVVVVDDHAIVLEGLERSLRRSGFDVLATTTSPDAAVDLVKQHRPDLCIVDLRIGEELGTDLIPRLRAVHDTVRTVVLTSFADGKAARAALAAGATGFLLKDTASDDLTRQLASIVNGATVIDDRVSEAVFRPQTSPLSEVQIEMLTLVARGATNAEIARDMNMSAHTVKDHLAQVLRSLSARTRAEAVARGIAEGLFEPHQAS